MKRLGLLEKKTKSKLSALLLQRRKEKISIRALNHLISLKFKMKNQKPEDVEKLFFIYEAMLLMEEKEGKYLAIEALKKEVVSTNNLNKENNKNIKTSSNEFDLLLNRLLSLGIVFYPRKGIVQRLLTFRWKDVENRSKFEGALIDLIVKANEENLDKLRKVYPELVKEFRK